MTVSLQFLLVSSSTLIILSLSPLPSVGTTQICPVPLGLRDSGKADPPCQYPCPNPLWDHNQHEISYVMTTVGAVITFVSATYVLLAWLAQVIEHNLLLHFLSFHISSTSCSSPNLYKLQFFSLIQEKLRKFPANLPMYPMVANIFAGIIMIISSGIGHESVM
jgi:hypothetical protein